MILKVKARRSAHDPAEPWDAPYTPVEGEFYFRGRYAGHPFAPRTWDELPPVARDSLDAACGVNGLRRLLIIPSSVCLIGQGSRKVITPLEVLAIGSRAVGLWREKPKPGVKISIPVDALCAIEDVHLLLYGRLSLIAAGRRLTLRRRRPEHSLRADPGYRVWGKQRGRDDGRRELSPHTGAGPLELDEPVVFAGRRFFAALICA